MRQPVAVDQRLDRPDVGERREHDDLDLAVVVPLVGQREGELLDQHHRFLVVEVHLPVARHDRRAALVLAIVQSSRTVMPGSSLPSRYSRLAPPPVEMWPNAASSKPSVRTAAAESPPPTTVRPPCGDLGERLGDRLGARRERVDLEHAHRAVPEHGLRVGERLGVRRRGVRADVEAERSRPGSPRTVRRPGPASGRPTGTRCRRRCRSGAAAPRRRRGRGGGSRGRFELVLLQEALADLVALRRRGR